MVALANFVMETTSAPGNAQVINLNGPYNNGVTFAAAYGNNVSTFYFLDDGTQAEWGIGLVTVATPNTLTRTTVINNTAGTTVRLSFLGSTKVYSEIPASRVAQLNANGSMTLGAGQQGGELDATVWSDLDWRVLVPTVGVAGTGGYIFTVPAGGYGGFKLECRNFTTAAATNYNLYCYRGGTSNPSNYNYGVIQQVSGAVASTSAGSTSSVAAVCFTENVGATYGADIDLEINVNTGLARWDALGMRSATPAVVRALGESNSFIQATSILIINTSGGNQTAGNIRVLGRK